MSIWDDPELANDSDYVTFENVGDKIVGTVQSVRKHVWADGTVCPKVNVTLDGGEEKTITAGQVRLKAELAAKRPEPGDRISITLTEIEKRSGGKTLKHFEVLVKPGDRETVGASSSGGSRQVPPF